MQTHIDFDRFSISAHIDVFLALTKTLITGKGRKETLTHSPAFIQPPKCLVSLLPSHLLPNNILTATVLTSTHTLTTSILLPPGTTRPAILALLSNHVSMIRLSPLVVTVELDPTARMTPHKHFPMLEPAPVFVGTQRAGELSGVASWIVERLGADTLDFKASCTNLPDGQRTDVEAPLGIKSFTRWTIRAASEKEVKKEGLGMSNGGERWVLEEATTIAAATPLIMLAKQKLRLEHECCQAVIVKRLQAAKEESEIAASLAANAEMDLANASGASGSVVETAPVSIVV